MNSVSSLVSSKLVNTFYKSTLVDNTTVDDESLAQADRSPEVQHE